MAVIRVGDQRIDAVLGDDVLGAVLAGGGDLPYLCMSGSCGTCRVRVRSGGDLLEPLGDLERMKGCEESNGLRLACQARLVADGTLVVEPA